jgi:hypothetical protein
VAANKPRLREPARFERRLAVSDGFGNAVGAWDTAGPAVFEGFAQFNPINGREQVLADKLGGVQPYEVVIRRCDASALIAPQHRVVRTRTGETFDITGVQGVGDRPVPMYLSILCVKGKADG